MDKVAGPVELPSSERLQALDLELAQLEHFARGPSPGQERSTQGRSEQVLQHFANHNPTALHAIDTELDALARRLSLIPVPASASTAPPARASTAPPAPSSWQPPPRPSDTLPPAEAQETALLLSEPDLAEGEAAHDSDSLPEEVAEALASTLQAASSIPPKFVDLDDDDEEEVTQQKHARALGVAALQFGDGVAMHEVPAAVQDAMPSPFAAAAWHPSMSTGERENRQAWPGDFNDEAPRTGMEVLDFDDELPNTGAELFDLDDAVPHVDIDALDFDDEAPRTGMEVLDFDDELPNTGAELFDLDDAVPHADIDALDFDDEAPRTGAAVLNFDIDIDASLDDTAAETVPVLPDAEDGVVDIDVEFDTSHLDEDDDSMTAATRGELAIDPDPKEDKQGIVAPMNSFDALLSSALPDVRSLSRAPARPSGVPSSAPEQRSSRAPESRRSGRSSHPATQRRFFRN
ncbi:MAG: hypothetical protein ACPGUV_08470 [Polyangiales bacterium]